MTDEFDINNRTEERIGGDIDRTPTKRLQTERPDRATKGRIILTLHYDVERKLWGERDTDAVDVLRRMVDDVEDLSAFLADQTCNNKLVVDIDLEAIK